MSLEMERESENKFNFFQLINFFQNSFRKKI